MRLTGITRRRRGKGFEYVDEGRGSGSRTRTSSSASGRSPSRRPGRTSGSAPTRCGHIQATGMDARGRKQYRYHDRWRERRDRQKFDAMLDFARALPQLRERVDARPAQAAISRERVLACAVRLLDRGFFRIGSEDYAEENETYGLATMRKRHVTIEGDTLVFDYEAKGGKRRVQTIADPSSRGWSRRCGSGAAGATSCSPTATGAAGATSGPPRSTTTSRRRSGRSTAPRTSGPGTRPCSPRWCSPPRRGSAT